MKYEKKILKSVNFSCTVSVNNSFIINHLIFNSLFFFNLFKQ